MSDWAHLADEQYCNLTTEGRVSGRPHRIEIWFAIDGPLYMLSGGGKRSDWVRNLRKTPEVSIELGEETFAGVARVVTTMTRTSVPAGSSTTSTRPATAATSPTGAAPPCQSPSTRPPEESG